LAKKFKNFFIEEEFIIRFIYSDHVNTKTNTLRSNFVHFRPNQATGKSELSCNRFMLDRLANCRLVAKSNESSPKRSYYGVGCTQVSYIREWKVCKLIFTPDYVSEPPNVSHTDIYILGLESIEGQANDAAQNLNRDLFKEIWKPYRDDGDIVDDEIRPYRSIKDFVEVNRNRLKTG